MKSSSVSRKKKMKSLAEGTSGDRLSELPDEVLVNILSFLPTVEAVRTLLLRRFGNLWTQVRFLSFSDEDTYFISYADGTPRDASDQISVFSDFVSNVLIRHNRSSINNFKLYALYAYTCSEWWVGFALSKEVKTMTMNLGNSWGCASILPGHINIFVCQSLVSLELVDCEIKQLSRVHMGSLRQLTLEFPEVDVENLKLIISGCPSLEQLYVLGFENLCIESSSLKKLKLRGGDLDLVRTLDCPNLELLDIEEHGLSDVEKIKIPSHCEVKIKLVCYFLSEVIPEKFCSLLMIVGNARVFMLRSKTVDLLAYCSIKKLDFKHNIRCHHFILELRDHEGGVLGICRLLRNSLCSEELVIFFNDVEECLTTRSHKFCTKVDTISNMLAHELSSPCVLPQLKIVTFCGFEKPCQGHALQLAEFILKSAVNLEKLQFL